MHVRRVVLLAALPLSLTLVGCGEASDGDAPTSSPTTTAETGADGASSASVATDAGAAPDATSPATSVPTAVSADASVGSTDAAVPFDAASLPPIDTSAMTACASDGSVPFRAPGVTCLNFTPIDTGEPSAGENAGDPHWALRPASGAAPSTLVLFLVGSGGHPKGPVEAGPQHNFYDAAVQDGRAVLGLAYANVDSVGSLCGGQDACFEPTRTSILLGVTQPGSAIQVTIDEGVADRMVKALRYLEAGDPQGNWTQFLVTEDPSVAPEKAIAWPKIIVSGHSQGGGHAALLGKLFPVLRVVQLSSPCDNVDGTAATWTNGQLGTWATDPTTFYGLAAPTYFGPDGVAYAGDMTCRYHATVWANLGMRDDYQNDDAETCGDMGDTHDDSLKCKDNWPNWLSLLQ
jgi:hypothetical protein